MRIQMKWQWLVLLFGLLGMMGCASSPPQTVEHVDLARYMGTWYEIARIPQWFEAGCVGATAEYSLRADGKVAVVNRCREGTLTGRERHIVGTARVVDAPANAKLKVTFTWPFEGDYWILRLNNDYTTAAVGTPDRHALWILHRTPQMDEGEYTALLESLKADGWPVERLERPEQGGAAQVRR